MFTNAEEIPGINVRNMINMHGGGIGQIAWMPNHDVIAASCLDNSIRLYDSGSGASLEILTGHSNAVLGLSYSPDGRKLATASEDYTIRIWDLASRKCEKIVEGHTDSVLSVSWSADGQLLASSSKDRTVRVWTSQGDSFRTLQCGLHYSSHVAWSPQGKILAFASTDKNIWLWDAQIEKWLSALEGHAGPVTRLAWSSTGTTLASASDDRTIRVWSFPTGRPVSILEGHTNNVIDVSFSFDTRLLASKSKDGTVTLWRCDNWEPVARIDDSVSQQEVSGLSFHPKQSILTTFCTPENALRLWNLNIAELLIAASDSQTIRYTSAKVVLVGESNVGKSCLALRLAENRYEEQGTTHGMRRWNITWEQLNPGATLPPSEKRDVFLWDLGGQNEYRLIHQLFLHDTTLAFVLFDPTRGRTAREEVEGWSKRLEKQLHGRTSTKFLVGAKLDQDNTTIDRAAIDRLLKNCGFKNYFTTSAKTGGGIPDLRKAIAQALDWTFLAKTSRPALFQRIRDEIGQSVKKGDVVILYSELERLVRNENRADFDSKAVNTVVEQLAMQGVITDARLASGDRALVLQISEVERYGGSLVIAARDNARGVPAIEEKEIASPTMSFPGIDEDKRLPRLKERIVLECVVQLFLEHGICLRHEGLLIFPSLFQPTESDRKRIGTHSAAVYYDFSGAIDNIYSSLVAQIAISNRFGRMRLWDDRAEFEPIGEGVYGLCKVERRGGFAHLDVYFNGNISEEVRALFMNFIDNHLRQQGVEIYEHIEATCVCGYIFPEEVIRMRIADESHDIGCPTCDRRVEISKGVQQARESDPDLDKKTWALRTVIEKKKKEIVQEAKKVFAQRDVRKQGTDRLRILHISDLHMTDDVNPIAMLQPLIADLRDRTEGNGEEIGWGFEQLDYLVVSGDLTNRALPQEFENARVFISGLIEHFQLTAERCIIVPGNHDLSWDEPVYKWSGRRPKDVEKLAQGTYVEQPKILGLRDNNHYRLRFKNFSEYFYHPLIQKEYPLAFSEQCIPFLFPENRIQFLAMNSCWEIDEFFPSRSSIHPDSLSYGIAEADNQIEEAKKKRLLPFNASVLRVATWHHPVSGNEKMRNDSFLDRLRQAGVKLCLHGHIHEELTDVNQYLQPVRRIFLTGAGSFGAPAHARPESIPRLYNVLLIAPNHKRVWIHTRCLRKDGGAWEGWAVWPGSVSTERRTYYEIEIPSGSEIGS